MTKKKKEPDHLLKYHIPIKKKWFDMILKGEKKEEYREIKKHWTSRLKTQKNYILFHNGYGPNVPKMIIRLKEVTKATPNKNWCPESTDLTKEVYVFHLGKIIITENLKEEN